jgi:hypothetical protein
MTIINRSEHLSLPLAVMLSRMEGATVYSVDVDSVLRFRPDGRVRRMGASSASAVVRCIGMSTVIVSGVPSASFRIPTDGVDTGERHGVRHRRGEEQLRRGDSVGRRRIPSGRDSLLPC